VREEILLVKYLKNQQIFDMNTNQSKNSDDESEYAQKSDNDDFSSDLSFAESENEVLGSSIMAMKKCIQIVAKDHQRQTNFNQPPNNVLSNEY
jgi:hypothetical protein